MGTSCARQNCAKWYTCRLTPTPTQPRKTQRVCQARKHVGSSCVISGSSRVHRAVSRVPRRPTNLPSHGFLPCGPRSLGFRASQRDTAQTDDDVDTTTEHEKEGSTKGPSANATHQRHATAQPLPYRRPHTRRRPTGSRLTLPLLNLRRSHRRCPARGPVNVTLLVGCRTSERMRGSQSHAGWRLGAK